jgi:hypothetical protein
MLPPESPGSNLFREFENTLEELQPPEPAFIPGNHLIRPSAHLFCKQRQILDAGEQVM